jgi:hypothetical protein
MKKYGKYNSNNQEKYVNDESEFSPSKTKGSSTRAKPS